MKNSKNQNNEIRLQDSFEEPNVLKSDQNHDSYSAIKKLLAKAHNQVKNWEHSGGQDSVEDMAQVPISDRALKSNIIKNSDKDTLSLIFKPITSVAIQARQHHRTNANSPDKSQ